MTLWVVLECSLVGVDADADEGRLYWLGYQRHYEIPFETTLLEAGLLQWVVDQEKKHALV